MYACESNYVAEKTPRTNTFRSQAADSVAIADQELTVNSEQIQEFGVRVGHTTTYSTNNDGIGCCH